MANPNVPFKTVVNWRPSPVQTTAEIFGPIIQDSRGYESLIVECPQENSPTSTTYVAIGDFTFRTSATPTTLININEQILSSTPVSLWPGLMLGHIKPDGTAELAAIQSVTTGSAGSASILLSGSGFSSTPSVGDTIYSPRIEQRDNNPASAGNFKVLNNQSGVPSPIFQFNTSDNGRYGITQYLGMGSILTDLQLNQYNTMYTQTQSDRMIISPNLATLNSQYPPSSSLEGKPVYISDIATQGHYTCRLVGAVWEWVAERLVQNTFIISSTTPVSGGTMITNGTAQVIFNQNVAIGSVTSSNFAIKDGTGTAVPATPLLLGDLRTVQIIPSTPLINAGNYTLFVGRNVTDTNNDLLSASQDFSYAFTAVADPAPTAPVITAVANSFGNITVNITTASTDSTPGGDTITYDVLVDGSVLAGNSNLTVAQLSNRSLGTSYAVSSSHNVSVNAKDTHGNVTPSNTVALTIPANQVPVASNVAITGTASVGSTLTGSYTYYDAEGEADISTYQWYRSTGATWAAATPTAITGSTGTTYILASADVGYYIYFEVTPKDASGTGVAVQSSGLNLPSTFTANFSSASDLTNYFGISTAGATSIAVDTVNGVCNISGSTTTTDAGLIYGLSSVPKDAVRTLTHKVKAGVHNNTYPTYSLLELLHKATPPTVDTAANFNLNRICGIEMVKSGVPETSTQFIIRKTDGNFYYWNSTSSTWVTSTTNVLTNTDIANYYIAVIEANPTQSGFRMLLKDATGTTTLAISGWVLWSDVIPAGNTDNVYFWWGDPFTNAYANNYVTDSFSVS